MSGSIAEAPVIVGKALFEGDDGAVPVVWLRFSEERDDEASPFEVVKGGRLVPMDDVGSWGQWKALAALIGPGGE